MPIKLGVVSIILLTLTEDATEIGFMLLLLLLLLIVSLLMLPLVVSLVDELTVLDDLFAVFVGVGVNNILLVVVVSIGAEVVVVE